MELASARSIVQWPRGLREFDLEALALWVLVGGTVLYLAIDGGGYDVVVHSQAAIIVWWIVLLGAACGVLPRVRPRPRTFATLALFGGFVAWTALASTWSISTERSLQNLSLLFGYFGVLVLGISLNRDRDRALRHVVNALAASVVIVAGLAVLSRLRPDIFASAQQTASYLPGVRGRLSWPLNYWNALAALVAFGLPLLLSVASTARTVVAQAAAAAGIPILMLCAYLTFSRGGAIAAAAALAVFFALAPDRVPKLATAVAAGLGSAVLIAGAVHRHAIEHGLTDGAARHQGRTLLIALILTCAGVALAQVGIGLAARHGTPPRWLVIPANRARQLLAVAVVVCVAAGFLAHVPSHLSHAWGTFKHPREAVLFDLSPARFGAASGTGRYDLWKIAVTGNSATLLQGSGPGTYQLLWLPRAPYVSYAQNAHSLYLETLAEVGVVGLVLLVSVFALILAVALRLVVRTRHESRARAAAAVAALVAFCVSAAADWVWQIPALPAGFLLLSAALLGPTRVRRRRRRRPGHGARRGWEGRGARRGWEGRGALAYRVGMIAVAVAALVAVSFPLAVTNAVRQSQTAVARGDASRALSAARTAARLEPAAAAPQLQLALVLELQHALPAAVTAAQQAVRAEPGNWSTWLIVSRLQAESGRPTAALAAYRRARSLNPRSLIFAQ